MISSLTNLTECFSGACKCKWSVKKTRMISRKRSVMFAPGSIGIFVQLSELFVNKFDEAVPTYNEGVGSFNGFFGNELDRAAVISWEIA